MIKKRLFTDLSQSECLRCIKKLNKAAEPNRQVISIKEKYKRCFMPRATPEGRHIYSSVKNNNFEVYMTVWYNMANRYGGVWMETQDKYSCLSGTVMETEEGSILEYTMFDHSLAVLLFTGILAIFMISCLVKIYFLPDTSLGPLLIVYLMSLFPLSIVVNFFVGAYKCRRDLQRVLRDIVNAS